MSTHNICSHAEIRKTEVLFSWKSALTGAMHSHFMDLWKFCSEKTHIILHCQVVS